MTRRRKWLIAAAGAVLVAVIVWIALLDVLPADIYRRYDAETLLAAYAQQRPAPKPVVIVDIDDTLMTYETADKLRLLFRLRSRKIKELEGASEAIGALQPNWNVVILTARDDGLKKRTLRWLDRQQFPGVPVVFSPKVNPGHTRQENFKRQAISEIEARGLRPAVGIGNSVGDAHAYLAAGMRAFIIVQDQNDEDFVRLAQGLEKSPNLKASGDRLRFFERNQPVPAWTRIVEELKTPPPR